MTYKCKIFDIVKKGKNGKVDETDEEEELKLERKDSEDIIEFLRKNEMDIAIAKISFFFSNIS